MFCNKCGSQIEDGAVFCGVCGNRMEVAPPVYGGGVASGGSSFQLKDFMRPKRIAMVVIAIILFIVANMDSVRIIGKWSREYDHYDDIKVEYFLDFGLTGELKSYGIYDGEKEEVDKGKYKFKDDKIGVAMKYDGEYDTYYFSEYVVDDHELIIIEENEGTFYERKGISISLILNLAGIVLLVIVAVGVVKQVKGGSSGSSTGYYSYTPTAPTASASPVPPVEHTTM